MLSDEEFVRLVLNVSPVHVRWFVGQRILYQALQAVFTALGLIVSILEAIIPKRDRLGEAKLPPPPLVKVSASRARVLCPECHSENDDSFRFCQWCGYSIAQHQPRTTPPLQVDEEAISRRYQQFLNAWAEKASARSRSATWALFSNFLASRRNGSVSIENAQPKDVVEFLCWLDSCGSRRRTIVHAKHCEAVGTKDLTACSTDKGECSLRYAFDSLRTNHVSKLSMVFEKEMGVVTPWSKTMRVGNPVKSELVAQYMAFTTSEQKQAGVLVKQAPVILRSHLEKIIFPMQIRLQYASSDVERVTLARDIAFFSVAFSTTKRGVELTNILIQRILRLPNRSGLMCNFQWGKTQRDGADHILTVPYDEEYVAICPVRAVERFIAVGKQVGWDTTSGYLFPDISESMQGEAQRGKLPVATSRMSEALKRYAAAVGETQGFSLHSFRSGGAVSRALAGDSLSTIMQKAYWKSPKTAWRYMRLMEVVAPGSEGTAMVEGVSEEQYRQLNEFGLSEQSRSLSAFSNKPLL